MRKALLASFTVLAFANLATAQVPTSGNVFFGYSYYNTSLSSLGRSNLNGWTASLEGKVLPHVGMVADFSQTFGSENVAAVCNPPSGPGCPVQPKLQRPRVQHAVWPGVSCLRGKVTTIRRSAIRGWPCRHQWRRIPTLRLPQGWAGVSITASSIPSPCASKAITSRRASSAQRRTTCACPPASPSISELSQFLKGPQGLP